MFHFYHKSSKSFSLSYTFSLLQQTHSKRRLFCHSFITPLVGHLSKYRIGLLTALSLQQKGVFWLHNNNVLHIKRVVKPAAPYRMIKRTFFSALFLCCCHLFVGQVPYFSGLFMPRQKQQFQTLLYTNFNCNKYIETFPLSTINPV